MPIIYYIQTRILAKCNNKKQILVETFNTLRACIGIGGSLVLYLLITSGFSIKAFFALLLYLYAYIIFINFYEIGCIHNDYIAITKEKDIIIHTKDNPPLKWYINSIIIRVFTGIMLLIPLLFVSKGFLFDIAIFMILLSSVFLLHNKIRIVFYNFITLFLLRFLKFGIVFPILTWYFGGFNYELLFLYTFILFIVDFFSQTLNRLSIKMGGNNKVPIGDFVMINLCICFILGILFKESIFLYYGGIFLIELGFVTPIKYLKLKNNPTSRTKEKKSD